MWSLDPDTSTYKKVDKWKYSHVPRDLAFKPRESVLAVAERKLNIYSSLSSDGSVSALLVSGKKSQHDVGAIAWGQGPTMSHIFASSEPNDPQVFLGFHKAFDAVEGKLLYTFEEHGAGDTMAVTENGDRLALLTRGEGTNNLSVYDIRRATPKAILSISLRPFEVGIEGEVNSAAFSTDGIYLALGRNDNRTHVYDARRLDRLLFDYEHFGESRTSPGCESYGVVQVQWLQKTAHTPFGLITGGNDGFVRFWDPLTAAESDRNGLELAQMNSDIGTFCVGDIHKGERPLVVGDCTGEVCVFDVRPSTFFSRYR